MRLLSALPVRVQPGEILHKKNAQPLLHLLARPAQMAAPSYNNAMTGKLNLKGGLPSTAKKCAITELKCL